MSRTWAKKGRALGGGHNADAGQNELVEHALRRSLALHAQALGQVGDGATGLLEHVGHAAGDIGGAGVLAYLLSLGIESSRTFLPPSTATAAAPKPTLMAPLTS